LGTGKGGRLRERGERKYVEEGVGDKTEIEEGRKGTKRGRKVSGKEKEEGRGGQSEGAKNKRETQKGRGRKGNFKEKQNLRGHAWKPRRQDGQAYGGSRRKRMLNNFNR